jgi:glycine cleavage system H protein
MMYLEGFYGQRVEIAEDRRYDGVEELWVQERDGGAVRIGCTKVGILLMGGIESAEFFVEPGDELALGADLAFFETFKSVRYVVAPLAGEVLAINDAVADDPELFDDDPYGDAWMVEMRPAPGQDLDALFRSPADYFAALERSEHCAEGSEILLEVKKGSPTCRSVYGGIRGNEPGEGSLSWKEDAGGDADLGTPASSPPDPEGEASHE